MAAEAPITAAAGWHRNTHKTFRWTVKDGDGAVVDISAFSFTVDFYRRPEPPNKGDSPEFSKTGTVTDGPNGLFTIASIPADTTSLVGSERPSLYYIAHRTDDPTDVVAKGPATLLPNP